MPRLPFILIPPSEGKEPGGSRQNANGVFDEALAQERTVVEKALKSEIKQLTPERAEALFKARGVLLERAEHGAKEYGTHNALVLAAWQRYSGVVWAHLHAETLSMRERERIMVPSGLYGITSAEDLIVDYRLTMNVKLGALGNLAAFWRTPVSNALANLADGAVIVDLLPNEHRAAIGHDILRETCEVITVDFVSHNGHHAAGHGAKAVKGTLARVILESGVNGISAFRWEGWRASTKGNAILVREPKR